MQESNSKNTLPVWKRLNEDWWSVLIAFLLILLSAIGLLGPNGIKIVF
jgi:hypothetical protein